MMNKRLLKPFAIFMVLVSMFISVSLAWETMRTQNHLNGLLLGIAEEGALGFNINVYQYDLNRQGQDSHVNVLQADENGVFNVVMNNYDTIFTSDNEYSSVLIRVMITPGNYNPGDIITLTISRNPALDTNGSFTQLGDVLSSVARIQHAVIPTTTISGSATADSVYDTAKNYFENTQDRGQTFVSIQEVSSTKTEIQQVERTGYRDVTTWSSTTSLTAGDTIKIGYGSGSTKNYIKLSGSTIGTTTNSDEATEWVVGGSSNAWTFKAGNYYLVHGSTSGSVSCSTSTSNNTWIYSTSNGLYYTYRSSNRTYYNYLYYGSGWTIYNNRNTSTSYKNISFLKKTVNQESYTYIEDVEVEVPVTVDGYVKAETLSFAVTVPSESPFYVYFYVSYDESKQDNSGLINRYILESQHTMSMFSDYVLRADFGTIAIHGAGD